MTNGGMPRSGLLCRLGGPARAVWAKHDRDTDGWLPLWRHMEDSAAVAGLLWDRWLPVGVRRLVAEALPQGESDARALVVWLAGVHDIGKATPAFACQVDQLADAMRDQGLEMRSAKAMGPDRRIAPHGLAGQVLLGEWLEERHGWAPARTGQFTVAVGGHHGVPPELDGGPRKPVQLPTDISPLVQGAYGEGPVGPDHWQDALKTAREQFDRHRDDQAERAAVFRLGDVGKAGRPLFGWVAAGVGDTDDTPTGHAQVRDSRDSLEVVVVQRRGDGSLATLPWLGADRRNRQRAGVELPQDATPTPFAARTAASCGLRLPLQFSGPVLDRAMGNWNSCTCPTGREETALGSPIS
ncbi:hypothetical protein SHIRM173S_07834 [Streptomyces hirsutus]